MAGFDRSCLEHIPLITDDREPAPEVYLIGGRMSEDREKHPTGQPECPGCGET